jgi:hypothetical protein
MLQTTRMVLLLWTCTILVGLHNDDKQCYIISVLFCWIQARLFADIRLTSNLVSNCFFQIWDNWLRPTALMPSAGACLAMFRCSGHSASRNWDYFRNGAHLERSHVGPRLLSSCSASVVFSSWWRQCFGSTPVLAVATSRGICRWRGPIWNRI